MDHGGSVQWELDLSHGRNAATVQDSESISPYIEGDTNTLASPFLPPPISCQCLPLIRPTKTQLTWESGTSEVSPLLSAIQRRAEERPGGM